MYFNNFSFTGFNMLIKFKFVILNGFKNIFFILRRVIYKFFVLEKLTGTYKNLGYSLYSRLLTHPIVLCRIP